MVAYLIKFDASEGFNKITDFLNGSSIKYALTVNPNIYVSCIKQFWTTVAVKKVNDVIRLKALVDKKKVVVTEASIRDDLCLDDAEGVECLPNEEIFVELARISYKKPSTKLTFYKAFFSSQWKKQVGDLSTHTTKYTSSDPKVFANMKRVGKGFSRIDTPLFEGMMVAPKVGEGVVNDVNEEDVNTGDVAEGEVSAANDEVPTVDAEPFIPSPTSPTPPPQPSHDIPSTSQAQPIPPQSPQVQPQSPQPQPPPIQDARLPINLLQEVMDTCTALSRRVKHLELDKIAQALKITKLKRRVKKLERRSKGRMIAKMDHDANVVLEEFKEVATDSKVDQVEAKVNEMDVVTTINIITEVVNAASETITAASTTITADEAQVPAVTLTAAPARVTAAPSRIRKGLVIRDPKESTTTTSTIIPAETKSKDKGKGILIDEPKPLKKQQQIKQDEKYSRELESELNNNIDRDEVIEHVKIKAKEDPAVKRYQALKRKPQTEAQAKKNMTIYLKNVAGFKMDYFKEMSYDDIRSIFEKYFDSNERFSTTKPKNFFDDFLLVTLEAMFEKPDIHAQIWKNQRSVHGSAKVKGWKLLESCSVQIITFTTTQLILLVERKYPLTRFTLDQMLNADCWVIFVINPLNLTTVSFGVDVAKGIQEKYAKCLMLLVKDLVLPSQVDVVD
nr:xylulose kinase-1 [Tanacetum cinerariifolium]